MDSKKWFRLFASCQIVPGKYSSAVYDLDRSAIYELPNHLLEVLQQTETVPVDDMEAVFGHEQASQIHTFLDKFVDKEIAFYTTEPERFPSIDFTWEMPRFITNAVIETDGTHAFDYHQLLYQLDQLLCQALQLRVLHVPSKEELTTMLLDNIAAAQLNYIELLLPFDETISLQDLQAIMDQQPRLRRIFIYAATADEILLNESDRFGRKIISFQKDIRIDPFEKIRPDRFSPNIISYPEALHHNIGLNRKVCINSKGEIKNYLSHTASFGNINNVRLDTVIQQEIFQEKWFLSNDKIEICKDCKYRYACVSNSDIREEAGKYYKVDMCSFNQQDNTWYK
ncbi:grasp-with-spasm system SPASM domain peptide maturase [Chitinophaga flava]|uniref:Grasp-with-spasm system SPASM domain peptide maturase n=1 Tax=Chitinophaga flava TaxID=2259036 RepID=A0A365XTE8_9BACT|nr:grasp-with-spasm system SPASM domain peptide maturase [Chitinophaga flava]RBL89291.1 grasp-with-spasm system SPASM domain peptide maturase [Chitinophaga flava]